MRKRILGFVFAAALLAAMAVPLFGGVGTALAEPPTPACNGLDVAHGKIHSSGTQGEMTLHVLRDHNHLHCSS